MGETIKHRRETEDMGRIIIDKAGESYEGCITNNPDYNPLNLTKTPVPEAERKKQIEKAEKGIEDQLGPELLERLKDEGLALLVELINNGPAYVEANLENLPMDPTRPANASNNPLQVGLSMSLTRDSEESEDPE